MGALLFVVSDLVVTGVKEVPEARSCTDEICKWTDPKASLVKPQQYGNIKIKKNPISRQSVVYGNVGGSTLPDIQDVLQLRQGIFNATHDLGYHVPAAKALQPSKFRVEPCSPPVIYQELPSQTGELCPILAPCQVIEVQSHPLPIVSLPCPSLHMPLNVAVNEFIGNVKYTEEEICKIEELTRGQSENVNWFKQRMGCVTSTMFRDVYMWDDKRVIDVSRLVRKSISIKCKYLKTPPKPTSRALKYGLKNESVARMCYVGLMEKTHENVFVRETGLQVHPQFHYLRCSPDGIMTCSCHIEARLIEIKCPISAENLTTEEAISSGTIKWLKMSSATPDLISLIPGESRGYYEQVQGTMAITGIKTCDFVIWTGKKIRPKIITVTFDEEYWSYKLLPSLKTFFGNHVVPEILGRVQDEDSDDEYCLLALEQVLQDSLDENKLHVGMSEPENDLMTVTTTMEVDTHQALGPRSPEDVTCSEVIPDNSNMNVYNTVCEKCQVALPEIPQTDEEASVGCDCDVCQCDRWYCWDCAGYDQATADLETDWFCLYCLENCQD